MGRSLLVRHSLRAGCAAAAVLFGGPASAQVPMGSERLPPAAASAPSPTPATQPASDSPPATQPSSPPLAPPAAAATAPSAAPSPPPPLDPPPSSEPATRPTFLKTREELERALPERKLPPRRQHDEADTVVPRPAAGKPGQLPKDFVVGATPWVDFSLTSFWMSERTSNFLNLGVQVGGYFVERLRLSARLVAPLDEARDEYDKYDGGALPGASYESLDSRSVAVLYGVSAGLILSNSKTFLFAPGFTLWRADEGDYGTTAALSLPFEWTTHRHLRVGFEFALGHAFGGSVDRQCSSGSAGATPCGNESIRRPGGTALLLQYAMGWALSPL